jgi:hypothetical protein
MRAVYIQKSEKLVDDREKEFPFGYAFNPERSVGLPLSVHFIVTAVIETRIAALLPYPQ